MKEKVNPLISKCAIWHWRGLFNDRGGEVLGKRMDWEEPQTLPGDASGPKNLWTLGTKLSVQASATAVPPACLEGAANDAVTGLVFTQTTSQAETRQEPSQWRKGKGTPQNSRTGRQGIPKKGQLDFQTVPVQSNRVWVLAKGFLIFQLTSCPGVFISCQ